MPKIRPDGQGSQNRRYELIMLMDADCQFDIRGVAMLVPYTGCYDIVAGYRIRRSDPWHRVLRGAAFKVITRLLFGIRVRAVDWGFTLFRGDLPRSLDLCAPGALINTDILALARRRGARMVEVGVSHAPRPAGEQSGGSHRVILRALGEILQVWWRLHRTNADADPMPPPLGRLAGGRLAGSEAAERR